MLTFRAFGQKTHCLEILRKFWNFWQKFNRKIEFLATFGKVVAKNRAFGNNIIFLQFLKFRGGGKRSLCSPWRRLWLDQRFLDTCFYTHVQKFIRKSSLNSYYSNISLWIIQNTIASTEHLQTQKRLSENREHSKSTKKLICIVTMFIFQWFILTPKSQTTKFSKKKH